MKIRKVLNWVLLTSLFQVSLLSPVSAIKDYSSLSSIKLEDIDTENSEESVDEKLSLVENRRKEFKTSQEQALNFIYANTSDREEIDLEMDNFFTQSEKEQLLELWRATLLRNRTIQFILKSLAGDPNDVSANNNVMQALTRAMFVPFYAIAAVTESAVINGGSMLGARVLGDVVQQKNKDQAVDQQMTRTDMVVMFMLVDQVAERVRQSYYKYKDSKIKRALIEEEKKLAQFELAEAIRLAPEHGLSEQVMLARMLKSNLDREERLVNLDYRSSRRTLIELAGEQAVSNIDPMIEMEIREVYLT